LEESPFEHAKDIREEAFQDTMQMFDDAIRKALTQKFPFIKESEIQAVIAYERLKLKQDSKHLNHTLMYGDKSRLN